MYKLGPSLSLGKHQVYSYLHLQNNLQVLLCPIPDSSVTAYMRAVSAGSKEEAGTVPMGAAHFIEHMSFRIQNGKIWNLASKGDVINAETNMDSTRFYVVHLPEQTEETISIDASRFKHAGVPADKVSTEMKAVLNELERGEQAGSQMFKTTSSVAILEHPYHHSTIGTKSDVQSTSAKDMENFRAKYYVPNNTTLIFVGKINPEEILQHVDTHFGTMAKGDDCHPHHTPEPLQTGSRTVELNIQAPCPMTCMAFHAPPGSAPESIVLQCIARLVYHRGEGTAKSLITSNTLHDVSTYSPRQLDPYLWFFHGTQEKTSSSERHNTTHKMAEILNSFKTRPVSEDALSNIKNSIADEWNRSTESVEDVMSELGRAVSMGDWKDAHDKYTILNSITPEDIMVTAQNTFSETNMTVTHVIPTSATVPLIEHNMKITKDEPLPTPAHLVSEKTSGKKHWTLVHIDPTTHIVHTKRANYVRAVLSARFSPAEHDTASLLVASMKSSSLTLSNSSELMSLHAERDISHDHEFIHMNMAMPIAVSKLGTASSIMFEKEWQNSKFDQVTTDLHKRHIVSELKSRANNQSYQVKKHFIQALFKQTQYNIPMSQRIERIEKTTTRDLQQFHARFLSTKNSTYVTMITPNTETAAELGKILTGYNTVPPNTTLEWTSNIRKASIIRQTLPGYGSAAIMMGQTIDKSISPSEKIALIAAAEILGGGMTGRLMHTVREQRGLGTYGIYAAVQTISDTTDHIICIQGTFSPTSLTEGLACTRELIQDWHKEGITENELANVKERLIGSRKIAMDNIDSLGSTILKYILDKKNPIDEMEAFEKTVKNLTVESVKNTIKKYVDPDKFAEVIVGPL